MVLYYQERKISSHPDLCSSTRKIDICTINLPYARTGKIIATKIPSRAACFRKEGAKRSGPGTDSGSRGYKPTWTSSRSPKDVPRRKAWLIPPNSTRSGGTLCKTAKRAFVVTDYPGSIPVCRPWGIIPSWSEAPKKKVQRRYRDLRWLLAERC